MKILALDTALLACSAAFWVDGVVIAKRFAPMERGHAEQLLPMVETVRREAGQTYGDLDFLAVTVGPGTFTGVRIGLAAARGLALAAARPLVGVTTLAAVAEGARSEIRDGEPILVALDARRGEVYAQAFDAQCAPLTDPAAIATDEILSVVPGATGLAVGTGVPLIWRTLSQHHSGWRTAETLGQPDAVWVAELAARHIAAGEDFAIGQPPAPLYLRSPGARLPGVHHVPPKQTP